MLPVGLLPACHRPVRRPSPPVGRGVTMLPEGLLPACPRPVRRPSPPDGRGCYHVTSGAVTCMSSPCSATVSTSREGVLPCYQWGCYLHVLALFGDRLHQSGGVLPCYQWGCYLHVLALFGDRLHQSGGGVTMLPVGLLPACPRPVRRPSPPVGKGCYHVTSGAVTCMSSPCSATVSTSRERMSESIRPVMGIRSARNTCGHTRNSHLHTISIQRTLNVTPAPIRLFILNVNDQNIMKQNVANASPSQSGMITQNGNGAATDKSSSQC